MIYIILSYCVAWPRIGLDLFMTFTLQPVPLRLLPALYSHQPPLLVSMQVSESVLKRLQAGESMEVCIEARAVVWVVMDDTGCFAVWHLRSE